MISREIRENFRGLLGLGGRPTVHVIYCGVLLLTFDWIRPWLNDHRAVFSVLGAVLMLFFAWRLARTPRHVSASRCDRCS